MWHNHLFGDTTFSQSNLNAIFYLLIIPPSPGPSNFNQLYILSNAGAAADKYNSYNVKSKPPYAMRVDR